MKQVQKRLHKT